MVSSLPSNVTAVYQVCFDIPASVKSNGFLWKKSLLESTSYPFPRFQLQLLLIFVTIQFSHFLLKCCGIRNALVSQIIAGFILGPSILGQMLSKSIYQTYLFPYSSQGVISVVTTLGYVLYLFMLGIKMDPGIILACGRKVLYTSLPAGLCPYLTSYVTQKVVLKYLALTVEEDLELVFITAIHSQTTFPVISALVSDLNLVSTDLGRLALSSALITDGIGVSLAAVSMLFSLASKLGLSSALRDLSMIISIIVLALISRPFMFWIIRRTPEGKPVKSVYVLAVLLLAMGSGVLSHFSLMSMTCGFYVFGLAVPNGPPLGSTLVNKLDFFISEVLVPPYVVTLVMRANLQDIKFESNLSKAYLVVVVMIILGKFIGSLIPPLFFKLPLNDAMALALIMSSKGIVELVLYALHRDNGDTSIQEELTFMILVVLFTALMVPILIIRLYDPSKKYAIYQHRNIMHLKPNSEFRILPIIHSRDNITSHLGLLQVLNPTKRRPISLYVLHLIEMVGRAAPIFVSHQIQTISHSSYSDHVLMSFRNFQKDNYDAVTSNVFTAISPHQSMHDDICSLAIEYSAHFIILPFHRKWSIDGLLLSEDMFIHNLNCSVLERAPCSVGIYVHRCIPAMKVSNSSSLSGSEHQFSGAIERVAVVYIGGNDDREALALANLMVRDSNGFLQLTIIHFLGKEEDNENLEWDKAVDMEAMKEMKCKNSNIKITREIVKDGPDTASKLFAVANDYDLFMVGRSHKKQVSHMLDGLGQWSEFSELGVVGDLLASTDFDSKASVLIVQHQNMTNRKSRKMDRFPLL